jgi:hypothetical protein
MFNLGPEKSYTLYWTLNVFEYQFPVKFDLMYHSGMFSYKRVDKIFFCSDS